MRESSKRLAIRKLSLVFNSWSEEWAFQKAYYETFPTLVKAFLTTVGIGIAIAFQWIIEYPLPSWWYVIVSFVSLLALMVDVLTSVFVKRFVKRGSPHAWIFLPSGLFIVALLVSILFADALYTSAGGPSLYAWITFWLVINGRLTFVPSFIIHLIFLIPYFILTVFKHPSSVPPLLVTLIALIGNGTFGQWTSELIERRQWITKKLIRKEDEILQARCKRAQDLLDNVLPQSVVERLSTQQQAAVIADEFSSTTVLFCRVFPRVNASTKKSESMASLKSTSTTSLDQYSTVFSLQEVTETHQLFSKFDELCKRHNAEKIKSFRTSYMAVVGVPNPVAGHASAMANLALDMKEELMKEGYEFKIGINSGPLVAGVIGKTKFLYDTFGSTVNFAARCQQTCPMNFIQISSTTKDLIDATHQTILRGTAFIKGVGEAVTFFLESQRVDVPGLVETSYDKTLGNANSSKVVLDKSDSTTEMHKWSKQLKEAETLNPARYEEAEVDWKTGIKDDELEGAYIKQRVAKLLTRYRIAAVSWFIFHLLVSYAVPFMGVQPFSHFPTQNLLPSLGMVILLMSTSVFQVYVIVISFVKPSLLTFVPAVLPIYLGALSIIAWYVVPLQTAIYYLFVMTPIIMSFYFPASSVFTIISSALTTILCFSTPDGWDMHIYTTLPECVVLPIYDLYRGVIDRTEFLLNKALETKKNLSAIQANVFQTIVKETVPTWVYQMIERGDNINNAEVMARTFENCTVVTADIVGFTELSRSIGAFKLIQVLNALYSRFDEVCERLQLFKVGTVGDAYVFVSGLDSMANKKEATTSTASTSEQSAAIAVEACQQMKKEIESVGDLLGVPLQMRFGASTGEVICGVIGTHKPNWDVFGGAVAESEQLEEKGKPGMLLASSSTASLLHNMKPALSETALSLKSQTVTYYQL